MGLGRLTHYSFDLILISIILAGIHRNTGLVFDTSHFSSIDVRTYFGKYLAFGEKCYDSTVSMLKMSGYFRQKNITYDYLSREAAKLIKDPNSTDKRQ